jgi:serine/threonine-protein kinase RsbW
MAANSGMNPQPTGPGWPPVLDQAFDGDSLPGLRAALGACTRRVGFSAAFTQDVVIAVHELVANAVRHGAGYGRLQVWLDREVLRCEVSDDGAPPTPGTGPGTPVRPWDVVPGHGLWLVRRLAAHASVRTGADGTIATAIFGLRPRPESAAPSPTADSPDS